MVEGKHKKPSLVSSVYYVLRNEKGTFTFFTHVFDNDTSITTDAQPLRYQSASKLGELGMTMDEIANKVGRCVMNGGTATHQDITTEPFHSFQITLIYKLGGVA